MVASTFSQEASTVELDQEASSVWQTEYVLVEIQAGDRSIVH